MSRFVDPVAAEAIEIMKEQLLIVLIKRLGNEVTIPVKEMDDTGQDILSLRLDTDSRDFTFKVTKKS